MTSKKHDQEIESALRPKSTPKNTIKKSKRPSSPKNHHREIAMTAFEIFGALRIADANSPHDSQNRIPEQDLAGCRWQNVRKDGSGFQVTDDARTVRARWQQGPRVDAVKACSAWHAAHSPGGKIDLVTSVFAFFPGRAETIPDPWWDWMGQTRISWQDWQTLMSRIASQGDPPSFQLSNLTATADRVLGIQLRVRGPAAGAEQARNDEQPTPRAQGTGRRELPNEWEEAYRDAFAHLSAATQKVYVANLRRLAGRLQVAGTTSTVPSVVDFVGRYEVSPGEVSAWKTLRAALPGGAELPVAKRTKGAREQVTGGPHHQVDVDTSQRPSPPRPSIPFPAEPTVMDVYGSAQLTGFARPKTIDPTVMPFLPWGGLDDETGSLVDVHGVERAKYTTEYSRAALRTLRAWHGDLAPTDLVFAIAPGRRETLSPGWWWWLQQCGLPFARWQELMIYVVGVDEVIDMSVEGIRRYAVESGLLSASSSRSAKSKLPAEWLKAAKRAAMNATHRGAKMITYTVLQALSDRLAKQNVGTATSDVDDYILAKGEIETAELVAWCHLISYVETSEIEARGRATSLVKQMSDAQSMAYHASGGFWFPRSGGQHGWSEGQHPGNGHVPPQTTLPLATTPLPAPPGVILPLEDHLANGCSNGHDQINGLHDAPTTEMYLPPVPVGDPFAVAYLGPDEELSSLIYDRSTVGNHYVRLRAWLASIYETDPEAQPRQIEQGLKIDPAMSLGEGYAWRRTLAHLWRLEEGDGEVTLWDALTAAEAELGGRVLISPLPPELPDLRRGAERTEVLPGVFKDFLTH